VECTVAGLDLNIRMSDMTAYTIRPATPADATVIAQHRVGMFRDMGEIPTEALGVQLLAESTTALTAWLSDRSYIAWLAVDGDGAVIAGAGVHIKPQLPRISSDGTRVVTAPLPLAVNVYTEPEWRGQGIARTLMKVLMQWAAGQGVDRMVLHASDAGRPLYLSLGFEPTNEMRWFPNK
jgi:GNAT superfamily N-acetyltransferase